MFETLKNIDTALLLKINAANSPLLDKFFFIISNDFFIYPFILVFLFFIFKKSGIEKAATLLIGIGLCVAIADISSNITKHSVKRYRPSHNLNLEDDIHLVNNYKGGKYGFFSSHAANTFAITTLLLLSALTYNKKIAYSFMIVALFIGYSRIYLGVHYPSDILIGAITGIFIGWLIHKLTLMYFYKVKTK